MQSTLWHVVPEAVRTHEKIENFIEWKRQRPFWGGVLLMLAGAAIAYVPLQFATELAVIGGSFTVIGLVFAVLVFLIGSFVLVRPEVSTVLGVAGIAFSILSIFGALGGLFIGMLLGIAGGNLCIAWQNPDPGTSTTQQSSGLDSSSPEDVQFSWQGDQ
jgi:hypothetical protein